MLLRVSMPEVAPIGTRTRWSCKVDLIDLAFLGVRFDLRYEWNDRKTWLSQIEFLHRCLGDLSCLSKSLLRLFLAPLLADLLEEATLEVRPVLTLSQTTESK
jgi:hypothetical protein